MIGNLWRDLRFAIRQLRRNSGFTVTVTAVLALGIGASLAIFSFVDASLIKPLPYRNTAELVSVYEVNALLPHSNLSYQDYLDWKRRNTVFSSIDVYQLTGFLIRTPSGTQPASGARVSDGFFRTLGVSPILGRDFYPGEDQPSQQRSVLLSYAAWQRRYGGRKDVLGQAVTLNGNPYLIVGVLPREFHFAPAGGAEFWSPFHASYSCDLRRGCHGIWGVARLRNGVSLRAALADVKSIAKQLEEQYPDSNRGQGADLAPLSEAIVGDIRPTLMVLMGGAGLLLLIAAVNVAGLLLVRSESRRREIAVRVALGGSAGRLISQFAIEALALAAAGSACGLALAYGAIHLLEGLISKEMMARLPFLEGLGLSGRAIVFCAIVALFAAAMLSLPPSLRICSSQMRSGLAEASRGSAGTVWRRLGSRLVVLELATAMVLLMGAGLLGRSLYRLLHVDLGIQPDHLITMDVVAPRSVYGTDHASIALAHKILERTRDLPGVKSIGVAGNGVPLSDNGNTTWFRVVGRPWNGEHDEVPIRDVSAAYFTTLGATLLRGRYFEPEDDASKPLVAIVNRAFTRQYFPHEEAIGHQIANISPPTVARQIVGVVDDIREGPLDAPIPPVLYLPFDQDPDSYFALVVRSGQNEAPLLPLVEAEIRKIDPDIVPRGGMTMTARVRDSPSAYVHRSLAWLVGGFAALALLLSVVGLYGVVAYSVSQRSREIGIRMALGAQAGSVHRLILREAAWLVILGLTIGAAGSAGAARLMHGLLFGVGSWDVPTLVSVALLLSSAAFLASLVPARRAASVNPVESLRSE